MTATDGLTPKKKRKTKEKKKERKKKRRLALLIPIHFTVTDHSSLRIKHRPWHVTLSTGRLFQEKTPTVFKPNLLNLTVCEPVWPSDKAGKRSDLGSTPLRLSFFY